jgi:hypothetical protein
MMGLSKILKCLFPFEITSPINPNKNFVFILVIQLMVEYHNIFHLIFQELWVNFKNVCGLWHKMKHKFKSPLKTKRWSFGFYLLLLTSYNNVYYKHESLFIIFFLLIGVRKRCHSKRYWIFILWHAKIDMQKWIV